MASVFLLNMSQKVGKEFVIKKFDVLFGDLVIFRIHPFRRLVTFLLRILMFCNDVY